VKSPPACSPLAFPPGLIPTAPRLQIAAADENRSVRLRAASKIFAARCLLAGRPLGPEYLQLFFAVSPKMVIQGLSADFATHARFSVLSPEHDDAAIENIILVRRRKPEITPSATQMSFKATTPRRAKSGCTINGTAFFSIEAYSPALRLPSLPTRNKDEELGKWDYHALRMLASRARNYEMDCGRLMHGGNFQVGKGSEIMRTMQYISIAPDKQ